MIYVTRKIEFSASHYYHNPQGHGHNYVLEVTVAGEPDPRMGMVVDLGQLDGFVEREILERFDLAYLNADADCFADKIPRRRICAWRSTTDCGEVSARPRSPACVWRRPA